MILPENYNCLLTENMDGCIMKALKKRVYSIPNLITKNLGVAAPRFLILLVSLFSTIQPFVK